MKSDTFSLINIDKPSEVTRFWKVSKRCVARPCSERYDVNGYRDINSNCVSWKIFRKYGCELVCFDNEVKSDIQTEMPMVVENLQTNRLKADKMFREFKDEVCNGDVQRLEALPSTQES